MLLGVAAVVVAVGALAVVQRGDEAGDPEAVLARWPEDVVAFADCPDLNRYYDEVLQEQYEGRPVEFRALEPNPSCDFSSSVHAVAVDGDEDREAALQTLGARDADADDPAILIVDTDGVLVVAVLTPPFTPEQRAAITEALQSP
jgi:hypothetical protein